MEGRESSRFHNSLNMKKIAVVLALAALVFQAGAQTYVPREGEISFKVLQTTKEHSIRQRSKRQVWTRKYGCGTRITAVWTGF